MLKERNVRFDRAKVGTSNGFLFLFFAVRKSDYELKTFARQSNTLSPSSVISLILPIFSSYSYSFFYINSPIPFSVSFLFMAL